MDPVATLLAVAGLAKQWVEERKKRIENEDDWKYIEAVSLLRKAIRNASTGLNVGVDPSDPDDPSWLYFIRRAQADRFVELFQDTVHLPGRGPMND